MFYIYFGIYPVSFIQCISIIFLSQVSWWFYSKILRNNVPWSDYIGFSNSCLCEEIKSPSLNDVASGGDVFLHCLRVLSEARYAAPKGEVLRKVGLTGSPGWMLSAEDTDRCQFFMTSNRKSTFNYSIAIRLEIAVLVTVNFGHFAMLVFTREKALS